MARVLRDYNSIDWGNYYYLNDNSPSGLSRKKDTYAGKNYKQLKYRADEIVGSKQILNGVSKGWIVELDGKPYKVHRVIMVMTQGRIDNSMVVDHLDGDPFNNKLQNLAVKTHRGNAQNTGMYQTNTSGGKGVNLSCHNGYYSWTATWYKSCKKKTTKDFSVTKYGYDQSKQMAADHRNLQISLLNAAGASYTDRHQGIPSTT